MSEKRENKVSEAADDIAGFGLPSLRTLRDVLLRPEAIVAAMEAGGPTGGGRYSTPLRFFVAINGVGMLIFFLFGGIKGALRSAWPEDLIERLASQAGKSVDAYVADFDQWSSMTIVPFVGIAIAVAIVPLVRVWTRGLWIAAFREGMTAINSWTVVAFIFSPLGYVSLGAGPTQAMAAQAFIFLALLYPFVRIGRGRWFTTASGGAMKAVLMLFLAVIATIVANIGVFGAGFLGARYL